MRTEPNLQVRELDGEALGKILELDAREQPKVLLREEDIFATIRDVLNRAQQRRQ